MNMDYLYCSLCDNRNGQKNELDIIVDLHQKPEWAYHSIVINFFSYPPCSCPGW